MRLSRRRVAAVLLLAAGPLSGAAQNSDPNDTTVVRELTLEKHPDIPNGRIAMVVNGGLAGIR